MTKDQQFAEGDHRNYNRDGAAFHVGETFNGIPFEKGVELVQELNSFVPQEMTLLQMALRWILDQPQVSTIIAGSSKAHQVESNAAASALPPLSDALHQQLRAFYYDKVRDQIRGGL
jgi:aryl-alcohol dehydrogenase-like predicted oxidoreductase